LRRVYRWLAWIVGVPVVAIALLVAAALWTIHQRKQEAAKFSLLPPGERQLAIYDAFASLVEANYYDRDFVERDWPPLRNQWRAEAAKARNEFDLYFTVLLQLTQKFPSSHVLGLPPPGASPARAAAKLPAAAPGGSGIRVAVIRRGKGTRGVVDSVASGSPAAVAGIEPGWWVLKSQSCKVGQEVTSEFQTNGSPQDRITLETTNRLDLHDPSIRTQADFDARYRKSVKYTCVAAVETAAFESRQIDGVTYLRFDSFNEPALVDRVLAALDQSGELGVILDLRGNSGGLRDEEMRFNSRLLPTETLIGTEITRDGESEFRTTDGPRFTKPLVVLIGPSTASAAEITAAALQDHRRARLVGRPTAGSTLTSGHFPLPDGGQAQIAFADFRRSSGQRIEAVGVSPDVVVMPTIEDVRAGRDPALERALLELRAARATASPGSPAPAG